MLRLDFAFFSFHDKEKKGLAGSRFVLDRFTPLFFSPRIEKLLYLPCLDKKGCSVKPNMGRQNFAILSPLKKRETMARAAKIAEECGLSILAVDRRFKDDLFYLSKHFTLTFGDNFIKALALAMMEKYLGQKEINRLVIIGKTEDFPDLVEEFLKYSLPLSLQSLCPREDEVMVYRFFYEKGYALSASCINPAGWKKGDLILFFAPAPALMRFTGTGIYKLECHDYSLPLVSDLKEFMGGNGWDTHMYNIAPVMEACLMEEAGKKEGKSEEYKGGKLFLKLKSLGDELDLWDMFLDSPD